MTNEYDLFSITRKELEEFIEAQILISNLKNFSVDVCDCYSDVIKPAEQEIANERDIIISHYKRID